MVGGPRVHNRLEGSSTPLTIPPPTLSPPALQHSQEGLGSWSRRVGGKRQEGGKVSGLLGGLDNWMEVLSTVGGSEGRSWRMGWRAGGERGRLAFWLLQCMIETSGAKTSRIV